MQKYVIFGAIFGIIIILIQCLEPLTGLDGCDKWTDTPEKSVGQVWYILGHTIWMVGYNAQLIITYWMVEDVYGPVIFRGSRWNTMRMKWWVTQL